jgi:hypothetical protein
MATFPTSGLTLGTLGIAFGDPAPYEMSYLCYETEGYIPPGWRVDGKSAPPSSKGSYVDIDRFRGGGYEPSYTQSIVSGRGTNDPAGSLFPNISSVYGYSGLVGYGHYGTITNDVNDEGWVNIGCACVAERDPPMKRYGFLLTLEYSNDKLHYKMNSSSRTLTMQISGASASDGTYNSFGATSDQTLTLGSYNLRQIWWDIGMSPLTGQGWNPFSGKTISCTINKTYYGL